ncbi:hypothetical protein PIB30_052182 [Stylosanthes scabra]|uniref:Uncharacterized protein n=1 Tax=Stylosanthes scabra TaxID=79078 RepID=A0ABU6UHK0_9FABA|nr:hypothetical protein [Stylosanthes scabra]
MNPRYRVQYRGCRCCIGVRDSIPFLGSHSTLASACCHQVYPAVTRTSSAYRTERTLFRIPAVTGLNLLSPGSYALVPTGHAEPRTIRNRPCASRGVGRIALRD